MGVPPAGPRAGGLPAAVDDQILWTKPSAIGEPTRFPPLSLGRVMRVKVEADPPFSNSGQILSRLSKN